MQKLNGNSKKGMLFRFFVTVLFCSLTILSTGCDDGSSYEARLEDAKIAIDEGDYASAKSILLGLPRTPEVLEYLSNAIAGGDLNLDMFNIISTMADLEDSGDQGSIDMIGMVIGGDDNQLTGEEIDAKLASATEAIELFQDIAVLQGGGVDELSSDLKMQLGLLSMTRITLTMADLISQELPADQPVEMTETWIRENRDGFMPLNPDAAALETIGEDLVYTGYAIGAISDTSDIKDDYETFKSDLDANGDNMTTADELNAFIADM